MTSLTTLITFGVLSKGQPEEEKKEEEGFSSFLFPAASPAGTGGLLLRLKMDVASYCATPIAMHDKMMRMGKAGA